MGAAAVGPLPAILHRSARNAAVVAGWAVAWYTRHTHIRTSSSSNNNNSSNSNRGSSGPAITATTTCGWATVRGATSI